VNIVGAKALGLRIEQQISATAKPKQIRRRRRDRLKSLACHLFSYHRFMQKAICA